MKQQRARYKDERKGNRDSGERKSRQREIDGRKKERELEKAESETGRNSRQKETQRARGGRRDTHMAQAGSAGHRGVVAMLWSSSGHRGSDSGIAGKQNVRL